MAKTKLNTAKLSTEEQRWRAEGDARTLAEAQKILADKKRYSAARNAALNMAKDLEKSANNMKLAAGGKMKK